METSPKPRGLRSGVRLFSLKSSKVLLVALKVVFRLVQPVLVIAGLTMIGFNVNVWFTHLMLLNGRTFDNCWHLCSTALGLLLVSNVVFNYLCSWLVSPGYVERGDGQSQQFSLFSFCFNAFRRFVNPRLWNTATATHNSSALSIPSKSISVAIKSGNRKQQYSLLPSTPGFGGRLPTHSGAIDSIDTIDSMEAGRTVAQKQSVKRIIDSVDNDFGKDVESRWRDANAGEGFMHSPAHYPRDAHRWRYCAKCKAQKPPRAHHCSICDACVLQMDHHCPWVGNCVGLCNYRYFVLFMFYVVITEFFFLCFTLPYSGLHFFGSHTERRSWNAADKLRGYSRFRSQSRVMLASVFAFAVMLAVGGLFLFHSYLIATGQSTIESMLNAQTRRWHKQRGQIWKVPSDNGIKKNWQNVFRTMAFGNTLNDKVWFVIWCFPLWPNSDSLVAAALHRGDDR